jgi:hypothetical protein
VDYILVVLTKYDRISMRCCIVPKKKHGKYQRDVNRIAIKMLITRTNEARQINLRNTVWCGRVL